MKMVHLNDTCRGGSKRGCLRIIQEKLEKALCYFQKLIGYGRSVAEINEKCHVGSLKSARFKNVSNRIEVRGFV